jgi:hypothetical protein
VTASGHPLQLIAETTVAQLLGEPQDTRLEASGVLGVDGGVAIVFDNTRDVALLDLRLVTGEPAVAVARPRMVRRRPGPRDRYDGYEDLARDPLTGGLYLLVESRARRGGRWMAYVEECDPGLRRRRGSWLDFPVPSVNKGLEGLTAVTRGGATFLLGLCEGNHCRDGAAGRRPGGGRIQVFGRGRRHWRHLTTIALPPDLPFADYAGLSLRGDLLAVVSQESSALWVGRLRTDVWQVDGGGTVHPLPRDRDGGIVYCTVEGVSWIGADRLVMVSDRAKPGGHETRCRAKQQSIHLFALPTA